MRPILIIMGDRHIYGSHTFFCKTNVTVSANRFQKCHHIENKKFICWKIKQFDPHVRVHQIIFVK
jgi:hypothetical protein